MMTSIVQLVYVLENLAMTNIVHMAPYDPMTSIVQ